MMKRGEEQRVHALELLFNEGLPQLRRAATNAALYAGTATAAEAFAQDPEAYARVKHFLMCRAWELKLARVRGSRFVVPDEPLPEILAAAIKLLSHGPDEAPPTEAQEILKAAMRASPGTNARALGNYVRILMGDFNAVPLRRQIADGFISWCIDHG